MRRVKVNLDDLMVAFEDQSTESHWYLDAETGESVNVSVDAAGQVEDSAPVEGEGEQAQRAFEEWLAELDCLGWEKDELRTAYAVERQLGSRFIAVPRDDSHEAYRDMVDFAESIEDAPLQELLAVALNGRGAFRRFKDVLLDYPLERDRWFAFRDERLQGRLLEWLHDEDIEVES